MKTEYRKVLILDHEDIEDANVHRKQLLRVLNSDKQLLGDESQQILHDAISYLEQLDVEYND